MRGCNVESVCSTWSASIAVNVPEPPPPPEVWLPTDDTDFPDAPVVNPFVPPNDSGVGAVQASGGVSGGSASYRIPIAVPPGRKGMQPEISLAYSSSSRNGTLGVGWSLNAGSAITRCAATPQPDGFTAAVQYDAARDRLCLDGRKLVVVSGSYGASGAQYRTELDSFARITQNGSLNGSTTSFTVEFKDGRVSHYGTTAASRHAAAGRAEILTWALRDTRDRSGNTITYDYQTFGEGEHLLDSIHYTGLNGSDGDRHVRFEYENRGHYRTSYVAGGKTRRTQRLKTIRTEYQTRLIRKYTLSYDPSLSSGRSLLRSIEECAYTNGVTEHCLPPTQFSWQEHSPQYETEPLQFENGGTWTPVHADKRWLHDVLPHGDANGDGVKDWTDWYVNAESEYTGPHANTLANCYRDGNSFYLTCLEVDFDADGLTDSFRRSNDLLQVRRASDASWINTGISWQTSSFPATDDSPLGFADFNGDGWPDLAFKQHDELYIYFHTTNMAAPYSSLSRQLMLTYPPGSGTGSLDTVAQLLGDMDGNGVPDIVVSSIGSTVPGLPRPVSILLLESEPGGGLTVTQRAISGLGMSISVNAHFFHDINGDGLADLLRINDTTHQVEYRLNDGTDFIGTYASLGFSLPMRTGTYERAGGMENETYYMPIMSKVLVMDYDGNGRQEMLVADTVLASGCAEVQPIGMRCDDELYAEYKYQEHSDVGLPIHADVLDESVRQYTAYRFDETAAGTITTTSFVSDIVASATQTAVIDSTGDGLPDVVTVFGCRWASCGFNEDSLIYGGSASDPTYEEGAWINRNLGAADPGDPDSRYEGYDLMSAAEDGLGVRHEWTYRPLSSDEYDTGSSDFYQTTHSYQASDPDYFHFASSMYVVADHRATNGIGGLNSTKYRYRGAIYNNKGRGFQGFKSIIVEEDVYGPGDPQAGTDTITRTDFNQKWPLSSLVEQACTWVATDNVLDDNPDCENVLSHTVTDAIHNIATDGGARFVAIKSQTTETFGLNSGLSVSTDAFDRNFDDVGNVTFESRSHTDAWTTNLTGTTSVFAPPDVPNWWLDKLTSRTVTHHPVSGRPGPAIATGTDGLKAVTTAYSLYNAQRLPEKVDISANDTALTLTVTTTYTARGLPETVTTTGTGLTGPRTVTTTYSADGVTASADGYFPFTMTNALGHVVETETDPAHGQPTRVTDPNGLVSTTAYDAFGRPAEVTPAGQPTQSVRYFWCDFACPAPAVFEVGTFAAGAPETHRYLDALGREVQSSVRNFAGSGFTNVRTSYDARGLETYVSQPFDPAAGDSGLLGTRYLGYDALARLQAKEQDQANGSVLLTSYTYAGLKTDIDAGGLLMHRIYNGLGQLVETKDAMGGFTRYAYDGAGNPIVLDDPLGTGAPGEDSLVAKYDAFGHKVWLDDPNLGQKAFTYDALGEVLTEQDINCPTSVGCDTLAMSYDALGRLTERRANGSVVGKWFYDNPAIDKGLGLLDREETNLSGSHGLQKQYFYSLDGSPRKDLERVLYRFYENGAPDTDYEVRYFTDSYYGRPKGLRYPGGVGVAYVYNDAGYRVQEKDASSSYVLRQVTARDARNRVTAATLANGTLTHTATYFPATGQVQSLTVSDGSGPLHELDYGYDGFGNLHTRSKLFAGGLSSETLWYDALQRLTESTRTYPGGSKAVHYAYDAAGNLLSKDDYATSYAYNDPRPNAVSSITKVGGGTVDFSYDANGNRLTGDGKSLTYTPFNQPAAITAGGVTAGFHYGADLARYRQDKSAGETVFYLDQLMEIVQDGASVEYRHYLGDVAILTKLGSLNDPFPAIRFTHRDRLGSVVTITDDTGGAEGRGYDPFGKPREPDGAEKTPPVLGSAITDRGFTDHEHLDESQLIHMNGRAYDYNLGRFLSVDPLIQAPGNSQSLNPYSYIMNNPLAGTDPSGYFCATRIGNKNGSICSDPYGDVQAQVTLAGNKLNIHLTGGNGAQQQTAQNAIVRGFKNAGFVEITSIGSQHLGAAGFPYGPNTVADSDSTNELPDGNWADSHATVLAGSPEERRAQYEESFSDEQREQVKKEFLRDYYGIYLDQEVYSGELRKFLKSAAGAGEAGEFGHNWIYDGFWAAARKGIVTGMLFKGAFFVSDAQMTDLVISYRKAERAYLYQVKSVLTLGAMSGMGTGHFRHRPWKLYDLGNARMSVDLYYFVTDQVSKRPPTCILDEKC